MAQSRDGATRVTCLTCDGKGFVPGGSCQRCDGMGKVDQGSVTPDEREESQRAILLTMLHEKIVESDRKRKESEAMLNRCATQLDAERLSRANDRIGHRAALAYIAIAVMVALALLYALTSIIKHDALPWQVFTLFDN